MASMCMSLQCPPSYILFHTILFYKCFITMVDSVIFTIRRAAVTADICHEKPTLCHQFVACFVAAFQLSYCKIYSQVPPSSMQADLPTTEYSFYLNTAPYM